MGGGSEGGDPGVGDGTGIEPLSWLRFRVFAVCRRLIAGRCRKKTACMHPRQGDD